VGIDSISTLHYFFTVTPSGIGFQKLCEKKSIAVFLDGAWERRVERVDRVKVVRS